MSPARRPHPSIEQQTGKEPPMAHASLTPSPAIAPVGGTPVLLALDLGTTTGWALRAADGLITSGTVSFRPSRYDGGGMRYVRFRAWLERDRKSTRLNSSHITRSRMPSSA